MSSFFSIQIQSVCLIRIGRCLAAPLLLHHRTYGSRIRRFGRVSQRGERSYSNGRPNWEKYRLGKAKASPPFRRPSPFRVLPPSPFRVGPGQLINFQMDMSQKKAKKSDIMADQLRAIDSRRFIKKSRALASWLAHKNSNSQA